jgi:hypothetical protein
MYMAKYFYVKTCGWINLCMDKIMDEICVWMRVLNG